MNTALLLIDIQNDYFEGGKYELFESITAAEKASSVLGYFRNEKLPVFHVQHISSRENATFFKKNTVGCEIHNLVSPSDSETVIIKSYPNSFRDTNLLDELNKLNISNLVVAGMMTHHCIDSTVRAAYDLGFKVTLLHDACATRNLEFNNSKISAEVVHSAFIAALGRSFSYLTSSYDYILTSKSN